MTNNSGSSLACGLVVRSLTASDLARWDQFVYDRPDSTFFHRAGWVRIIQEGLGHRCWYLFAERCGEVEGILPLAEMKSRLFGHSLVSTPCCVYGGVLAKTEQSRVALTAAAVNLAETLGVGALEIRNRQCSEPDWPTKSLYVTFRKAISADREENLKSIPRKQRAMVRKGIDNGLRSRQEADVDRFFSIYAESVRNLGTPVFPKRFFRLLLDEFHEETEISITSGGSVDVAAVLSFYFRDEVLPYYGGSRPAARLLKGNDFMYWDLMTRAAERGALIFDFGRSKVGSGSYDFKKNWGFVPESLYYQFHLVKASKIPEHNPNNPRYRYFIDTWKRLPLPVANTLGPLLARHLG